MAAGWQRIVAACHLHRGEAEIQTAPEDVRQLFAGTFSAASILNTSTEIEELAEAYMAAVVVSPKFADDALHVAMATVHGVRLIVSWISNISSTSGARTGSTP